MIDSLSSAEYRSLVGATDGPTEMSAEQFRQMRGNPMSASDLVPRLHSSQTDTEPPAKRAFRLALLSIWPTVAEEYVFLPDRKFAADWALVDLKIIIEYDGIADHASLKGMIRDSEKANLAQLNGWLFLRVNARSINDGSALGIVERAVILRMGEGS